MREFSSLHKFSLESEDGQEIAHLYLQECVFFDREWHYLEDVWTAQEHRGRGIATQLILRAIDYVAQDPFSSGIIGTTRYGRKVGETSDDLIAYYEYLGCHIYGHEDRYDAIDGVLTKRPPLDGHLHYGVMFVHSALTIPSVTRDDNVPVIHRICPHDAQITNDSVCIDTSSLGGKSRYTITQNTQFIANIETIDTDKYILLKRDL